MPQLIAPLVLLALGTGFLAVAQPAPPPTGRLIDIGGRNLHVRCTGTGTPAVVVETGLGDFSFDWVLVQRRLERFTRVCTYDRAGYAWSDVGPSPRTFDQLNLELHDALTRAGERGPFVLVGHSFGGGPVRRYAERYRDEVAGLVLAEIVAENQYIRMGSHAGRIRDDARGIPIPEPVKAFSPPREPRARSKPAAIDAPYDRLPAPEQALHAWAASLQDWEKAEDSQKAWSTEYYARWSKTPQTGVFGALPLIVLTRAQGGYGDNLDVPAAELERTRLEAQHALSRLSTSGEQRIVAAGHNLHLEAPADVERAIRDVVEAVRRAVR
jgi:pimeloyl-ACP methyl ester carboxylesterase